MQSARHISIDLPTMQHGQPRAPLTPEEIAKRKTAELGNSIGLWGFGSVAAMLAVVALCFNVPLALGFAAGDWRMVPIMMLIAVAYTIIAVAAPAGATILRSSHPHEAEYIMLAWQSVLLVATVGMVARIMLADSASGGWSPETVLPSTDVSGRMAAMLGISSAGVRKLGMIVFALLAIGGAGLFGKWAMLCVTESWRLVYAESAPVSTGRELQVFSPAQQQDMFTQWLNGNVHQRKGGQIQARRAYENYCLTCESNSVEPMTEAAFGRLMGDMVKLSNGTITRDKSNGRNVYRGLQFLDDADTLDASFESVEPLRIERAK